MANDGLGILLYFAPPPLACVLYLDMAMCNGRKGERENIFISTDERKSDNSSLVLIYLFLFAPDWRQDVRRRWRQDEHECNHLLSFFFLQGAGALILDSYFPVDIDQLSSF